MDDNWGVSPMTMETFPIFGSYHSVQVFIDQNKHPVGDFAIRIPPETLAAVDGWMLEVEIQCHQPMP